MTKQQWGNIELPGVSDDKLLNTNWNKVTASREKAKDSVWLESTRTGSKKRNEENIEWRNNIGNSNRRKLETDWKEKNKKVLQDRAKDPEWREKHAVAMKVKFDNPEYVQKHAEAMKNKTNDPEFMKKMKTISYKPLITPYGIFASITEAGAYEENLTGKRFNPNLFTKRLKDPESGYKRISKEEYIMLTGQEL